MKLFREIGVLSWTLGGTALVLITLSGSTRTLGLWIAGVSFVVHMLGAMFSGGDE